MNTNKYELPELDFKKVDWNAVQAVIKEANAERARVVSNGIKALFRGVSSLVLGFVDIVYEAAASSRLYAELSRMSDRQLEDIGLNREDLARFVAAQRFTPERKAGRVIELPVKAQPAELAQVKRAA